MTSSSSAFDGEFQRTIITPLVDERKRPEENPPCKWRWPGSSNAVRKFVYWMKIKQKPKQLAPFMQRCGDRLFGMGEVECARDVFFAAAMEAARAAAGGGTDSDIVGDGTMRGPAGGASKVLTPSLADKEWSLGMAAQIAYASANCDITATLASDPEVKFPQTVPSLRRALRCIQDAMSDLLHELPAAPATRTCRGSS